MPIMCHMGRQTLRMEIMVNRLPNPSSFRSTELQMDQRSCPLQERPLYAHRCAPTLRIVSNMYQIHIIRQKTVQVPDSPDFSLDFQASGSQIYIVP